jgi:hypothetical protein
MKNDAIADLPTSEARLLRWMAAFALLALAVLLVRARLQLGIAFGLGAALGILNFHWLWLTGKVLMQLNTGKVPRRTVVLLIARYPLFVAALTLLYLSGWLPTLPLIAGLLVPGAGVLAESVVLVCVELRHKQVA